MDRENRELAAAGPIARTMLTDNCHVVSKSAYTYEKKPTWDRPFVAPRDARLGDAAAMKMKMAPESKKSTGQKKK